MQKGGRHYFGSCFIGFILWLGGSIVLTLRHDSTSSQGGYGLAKALVSTSLGNIRKRKIRRKVWGHDAFLKDMSFFIYFLKLVSMSYSVVPAQGTMGSPSVEPNND